MAQINVFPECNVDTNLIGCLLGCDAKHKSSCNEVVKAVNLSDDFAIGIIDADKKMATLDAGFDLHVANNEANHHLALYIHSDGKRFMFTVKPAMDKFILDAAKWKGIQVTDYGYPNDLKGFTKRTKRIQASKDAQLRKLINDVKDYPEMLRFRNTLKYLVNNKYTADIQVVKSIFDGELDLLRANQL